MTLTVNAMLTVISWPLIMKTKKETTDTNIGAHVKMAKNITAFLRATSKSASILYGRRKIMVRTFQQPAKLHLTGIEHPLNPLILPGEELDEFDLFCLVDDLVR